MAERADIVIIGGGIAGVSLAARLAGSRRVVLLEAEEHFGSQSTGRSAALFVEAYGPPAIRRLTALSREFYLAPPPGFAEGALTRKRGALSYATADAMDRLEHELALTAGLAGIKRLDAAGVLACCPLLRPGVAIAGLYDDNVLDIDAAALLQGFVRMAGAGGVALRRGAPLRAAGRANGRWHVETPAGTIEAEILVDAAGAWADTVAAAADLVPLGLQPHRRTAATLAVPAEYADLVPALPAVFPVDESFYFKPEARSIMVSLADETPSEPCDAYPEDFDVAMALERFHEATIFPRSRPVATWAGLRTFAPDRTPVVGFDSRAENFFWCAGQGGYGIQTAPALSALAARLLLGAGPAPGDEELLPLLSPSRLRRSLPA
jgi:D-arginine dehydrogenase